MVVVISAQEWERAAEPGNPSRFLIDGRITHHQAAAGQDLGPVRQAKGRGGEAADPVHQLRRHDHCHPFGEGTGATVTIPAPLQAGLAQALGPPHDSLRFHGTGGCAALALLEFRIAGGSALIDDLASLLLHLLPIKALGGLAFRQHLSGGGSGAQGHEQKQGKAETARHRRAPERQFQAGRSTGHGKTVALAAAAPHASDPSGPWVLGRWPVFTQIVQPASLQGRCTLPGGLRSQLPLG